MIIIVINIIIFNSQTYKPNIYSGCSGFFENFMIPSKNFTFFYLQRTKIMRWSFCDFGAASADKQSKVIAGRKVKSGIYLLS